jgi:hypothetical protein
MALRDHVLGQLGIPSERVRQQMAFRIWAIRSLATGLVLVLALVATLILLPSGSQTVSAAEILDRAQAAVDRHEGMTGVLHWEADWSQRYPGGDEITRTFEIWFNFDRPGEYRLTQRDADGRVLSQMVRDGEDHMWQLSRAVTDDGRERILVDEIILSPEEMQELGSWYVPSPFLDDLDRLTDVLENVEKVAEIEAAGRRAYVLRGRLFGFGQPVGGNHIEPVTSTVELVVDAETFWVLGRVEQLTGVGQEKGIIAGVVQRTRSFGVLQAWQAPVDAFDFTPPPGSEVRTVHGISGYYAPSLDAIGLDDAAALTSFALVLPSDLPADLESRPHFRRQGTGPADTFGILYLGSPGRQAFLLEYERARPLGRAARMVEMGDEHAWLVPDPIDGHKYSMYILDPQPARGPDGRPWPGSVELQVWGLSLDEGRAMLASLEPHTASGAGD